MDNKHTPTNEKQVSYPCFTRNPEVEQEAFNILGLSPSQIKRMRLVKLEDLLRQFKGEQASLLDGPVPMADVEAMPTPKPRATAPVPVSPLPVPAPLTAVMAPSEVALAEHDVVPHQVDVQAEHLVAGLEHLVAPINVNNWLIQRGGIQKLNQRVNEVLKRAMAVEYGAKAKQSWMARYQHILIPDEKDDVPNSVQDNAKQLVVLVNWCNGIYEELTQIIRLRTQAEEEYMRIDDGNTIKLAERMHVGTMQMRMLQQVLKARLDCIRDPRQKAQAK